MVPLQLPPRLATVAAMIPTGEIVADIGTDHARLPVYLVEQKRCPRAVAADLREGPVHAARRTVARAGLEDYIDVRQGNGLDAVQPGEVSCIVVAGMGGGTIAQILRRGERVARMTRRLVLQPMTDSGILREALDELDCELVEEILVQERERIYEVLSAAFNKGGPDPYAVCESLLPGTPRTVWYELGPLLIQRKDRLLVRRIEDEVERIERRLWGLRRAATYDEERAGWLRAVRQGYLEVMDYVCTRT